MRNKNIIAFLESRILETEKEKKEAILANLFVSKGSKLLHIKRFYTTSKAIQIVPG